MRIYLFLFLFLFINHSATSPVKNSNNGPHITIKLIKPVNGYKITIIWRPFKENRLEDIVGPATMELTRINDNQKFTVNYKSFSIDCRIKDLIIKDDRVKSYSNTEVSLSYNAMKDKPFYFFDINFDGIKELIISEYGLARNNVDEIKKNKIFEFTNDKLIDISNYKPWNDINDFYIDKDEIGFHDGYINVKNKEIILTDQFGCCKSTDHIFGVNKEQSNATDRFTEVRTEDNDWQARPGYIVMVIHIPGKKDQTKLVKLKTR